MEEEKGVKESFEDSVRTTRLDLKTRICLMAAIIFGTADQNVMDIKEAIEAAVGIENLTNARVKSMKKYNPIPRKQNK